MDKETAKVAGASWIGKKEKEGNATMGCLAGLFYVWILYWGGLMGQTDHLSR